MNRFVVYFLYNGRGSAAVDHIVPCELPEGLGIADAMKGFWIEDGGPENIWKHGATYTAADGDMWVPPGRITAVIRK